MLPRRPASLFLSALIALCASLAFAQDQAPDVSIAGPLSTKPLLQEVVRAMKAKGLLIAISADVSSADAIDALATDKVGIALITRPLTMEDRSEYPGLVLDPIPIGMEVVALGVANDVWDAGVHSLSKDTMREIYERKITNWQQLPNGPAEPVTLFNPDQGQGVWEMFADWLYGDNRMAPLPKSDQIVGTNKDLRDALEFTPGGIGPVSAAFADGTRFHALGIALDDRVVNPTARDVADGSYPIVRPIYAVVQNRPNLNIRVVTEFLTGPTGQAILKREGNLGVEAAPTPTPAPNY